MKTKNPHHEFPSLWVSVFFLALSALAAGCVTPVFAASPPSPTPDSNPAVPTPTPFSPTPKPLPPTPTADQSVLRCSADWDWLDGRLVITDVDLSRADGLMKGDVILQVGGRPAEEAVKDAADIFQGVADPDVRLALALDYLLYSKDLLILQVQHRNEPTYFYGLHTDCG